MFEFVPRTCDWSDEWDELVEDSPDGWVFSLSCWQDLILEVERWNLQECGFGIRENGRLIAVVPLHYNPAINRMQSSGWGGSGPVLSAGLSAKARNRILSVALGECIARAKANNASFFDLSCSPVTRTSLQNVWGVMPFQYHGLRDISGISQLIDLRISEEELWSGLSEDARRQVRHARKRGFTVSRVDWHAALNHYYDVHQETYARTGVQPHPKAYFTGMARETAPRGNSVLFAAISQEGEAVAYYNAAWFAIGAFYHTGCSRTAANKDGVNYLLFWEAMLAAKRSGIEWLDCGPVFPDTNDAKLKGLTIFKTKFGGECHRAFKAEIDLRESATADARSCAGIAENERNASGALARAARIFRRRIRPERVR